MSTQKPYQRHDLAIISGSDSVYFELLRGLVNALRAMPALTNVPVYIFDAGLTLEQRNWLTSKGAAIVTPTWPFARTVPGYISMVAARPDIPEYFPGHDVYLWMDADVWPQSIEAIETYRRAALAKGFAVAPEGHPAYNHEELYKAHLRIYSWYGPEVSQALNETTSINIGIFAGAAGAPHWTAWRQQTKDWLTTSPSSEIDFNADQAAFQFVVYTRGLPTEYLPARYNWICHSALPMVSEDGITLLEPVTPYTPLEMIHMTLWTKQEPQQLKTPSGKMIVRSLTYDRQPITTPLPNFALKNL